MRQNTSGFPVNPAVKGPSLAAKNAHESQIPQIPGIVFAHALRFARNAFERRRPAHCHKATPSLPDASVPPPFRFTSSRTSRFPGSCGAPLERWRVLPNPVPSPHQFADVTSVPEAGCRSAVCSPGAGKPLWRLLRMAHQIAARSEVKQHQLRRQHTSAGASPRMDLTTLRT